MNNLSQKQKCYSCHKMCESKDIKILDCNHILCKRCLSISLIKSEFKNISYDELTLSCYCGDGKCNMQIKDASLFFIAYKNQKKTCTFHQQVVECYCENCKLWLCAECKTSFHDVQMKFHETSSQPSKRYNECPLHHIKFRVYCNQCENELCLECIQNDSGHSSFHIDIMEQAQIKKENIINQLLIKRSDDLFIEIEKVEEEYKNYITVKYENTKNKIEAIIQSLSLTLINMKIYFDKEIYYSNFLFNMMRYSYSNYYTAIHSEFPNYLLLVNISSIQKELHNLSIKKNAFNQIDKLLFDIKKLNKNKLSKLDINYRLFNEESKEKDNIYQNLDFKTCHGEFMSAMCSIDDGIYCTGSLDNTIKIFQLNKEENSFVYQGEFTEHKEGIKLIANAYFGRVASVSIDNLLVIWKISTGQSIWSKNSIFNNEINDLVINNNDQLIITGDNNILKVIDLDNGNIEKEIIDVTIADKNHSIRKLVWIDNINGLVSGDDNGSLALWNDWEITKRVIAHQSAIHSLIQMSDNLIALGGADNSIRILSLTEFNCLFNLVSPQSSWITSLCFIPQNKLLVSGSKDNSIVFWDASVNPYRHLKTIIGHKNSILFLSVTEQNNLLSGSCDTSIKLWKHFD